QALLHRVCDRLGATQPHGGGSALQRMYGAKQLLEEVWPGRLPLQAQEQPIDRDQVLPGLGAEKLLVGGIHLSCVATGRISRVRAAPPPGPSMAEMASPRSRGRRPGSPPRPAPADPWRCT